MNIWGLFDAAKNHLESTAESLTNHLHNRSPVKTAKPPVKNHPSHPAIAFVHQDMLANVEKTMNFFWEGGSQKLTSEKEKPLLKENSSDVPLQTKPELKTQLPEAASKTQLPEAESKTPLPEAESKKPIVSQLPSPLQRDDKKPSQPPIDNPPAEKSSEQQGTSIINLASPVEDTEPLDKKMQAAPLISNTSDPEDPVYVHIRLTKDPEKPLGIDINTTPPVQNQENFLEHVAQQAQETIAQGVAPVISFFKNLFLLVPNTETESDSPKNSISDGGLFDLEKDVKALQAHANQEQAREALKSEKMPPEINASAEISSQDATPKKDSEQSPSQSPSVSQENTSWFNWGWMPSLPQISLPQIPFFNSQQPEQPEQAEQPEQPEPPKRNWFQSRIADGVHALTSPIPFVGGTIEKAILSGLNIDTEDMGKTDDFQTTIHATGTALMSASTYLKTHNGVVSAGVGFVGGEFLKHVHQKIDEILTPLVDTITKAANIEPEDATMLKHARFAGATCAAIGVGVGCLMLGLPLEVSFLGASIAAYAGGKLGEYAYAGGKILKNKLSKSGEHISKKLQHYNPLKFFSSSSAEDTQKEQASQEPQVLEEHNQKSLHEKAEPLT